LDQESELLLRARALCELRTFGFYTIAKGPSLGEANTRGGVKIWGVQEVELALHEGREFGVGGSVTVEIKGFTDSARSTRRRKRLSRSIPSGARRTIMV
jgi:hypothetical protein